MRDCASACTGLVYLVHQSGIQQTIATFPAVAATIEETFRQNINVIKKLRKMGLGTHKPPQPAAVRTRKKKQSIFPWRRKKAVKPSAAAAPAAASPSAADSNPSTNNNNTTASNDGKPRWRWMRRGLAKNIVSDAALTAGEAPPLPPPPSTVSQAVLAAATAKLIDGADIVHTKQHRRSVHGQCAGAVSSGSGAGFAGAATPPMTMAVSGGGGGGGGRRPSVAGSVASHAASGRSEVGGGVAPSSSEPVSQSVSQSLDAASGSRDSDSGSELEYVDASAGHAVVGDGVVTVYDGAQGAEEESAFDEIFDDFDDDDDGDDDDNADGQAGEARVQRRSVTGRSAGDEGAARADAAGAAAGATVVATTAVTPPPDDEFSELESVTRSIRNLLATPIAHGSGGAPADDPVAIARHCQRQVRLVA